LVINKENRGIANIVIWAYKPKKAALHPSYGETAKDIIKMDNLGCRFEPHTVTVRVGQTLEVGNSDPVGHNSMISFIKNPGVNPLIPASQKVQFGPKDIKKAEIVPSKVACSIHPWMQGFVLVQDHPYMAVTDKDGKFEIKNMPTGKYTLKVWNGKYIQQVKVDGKKTKWNKGKYALNLTKDEEHKYTVDPANFK
jgi:plastocyanin